MDREMRIINHMKDYVGWIIIIPFILGFCLYCYPVAYLFFRYKNLAQRKNIPYLFKNILEAYSVILPVTYATVIFSQISKFIVKKALIGWIRPKKIWFLNGQDPLSVEEHPGQAVVPVLFLVNCKGDAEEFYTRIRQHFNNCAYKLAKSEKFFGMIESWNGYYHITNETTDINKYIKKLRILPDKEVIDKVDLLLLMEEYYALPLPKYNKALWQVFIGKQPVLWTTTQKCKLYPIMFKFSHCLCDQENFMKTLLGTFSDNKNLEHVAPPLQKPSIFSNLEMVFNFLKYSYIGLPVLIVNSSLLQFKRNILVGAELGNKKYFCIGKNDSSAWLHKVKEINRRTEFKTNLSCIFETAIVSSLSEFYQKYSYSMTEKDLVYATTIVEKGRSFTDLPINQLKFEKSGTCKNEVRFMLLNSPILSLQDLENPEKIMTTLKQISSLKDFVQKIGEPELTRKLFSGVFNYFPSAFQDLITRHKISPPTIVSNLTAPSSEISINGLVVEDIYGWCPNFRQTGITFSICTYRDTSRITLNADVNLIGSNADAQNLLDGVYKYIDLMYNSLP